ncbi:GntR family transcriptional regulator [Streptomyces griseoviridis]|uniref:GntR family transcriptional regulator n=2 Tax=Streptomyces TaxID=1883 RepID=A0A3Q9KYN3_STRGD|nr:MULTISPECIES: GntR family transcriptional regulator [Streptomyces]AZS89085.1 GntR family transcriptional regulator [Streptomyces griseoviridis]MDH6697769.1 DNA-binding GntR family transcriptional regulator [Streptomyces sp. MAA16]MDT0472431.1 GntR family transcriptional regulator [Streptomyces sp. DSM 41014]QCN84066.1 GntR family transcriptional regulator [Streptomyces griseoviridis]
MARTTPHDQPSPTERPLYWRVAGELLDELREGAAVPGQRLPSERRLARHYGVSRETVRQALEVLRRDGRVVTDRRGTQVTLPGAAGRAPSAITFPVGSRSVEPGAADRATVTWETPPPEHAEALGLAPHRPTLVHRYASAGADGSDRRSALTSFSPIALSEVAELARYRDRADGTAPAQLRLAYDWMRKAGLTLHHRDSITRLADTPSVRVTRRVHDQYARPLEITDLLVDARQDVLVYEFTLPAAG